MLKSAKRLALRGAEKIVGRRQIKELTAADVSGAREYIAGYWQKLERYHPKDDDSLLGLPKPYLVPAFEKGHAFDFNELYYWDSYFMVQSLMDKPHRALVEGILDDLESLFKRYGTIPNASRTYLTGRSQPPFLTSFIFDIYNTYQPGPAWLKKHIEIAKQEYETVWTGTVKPNARQVHQGLSRYYDINMIHDLAETESGWDMNPRFGRHCLHYLPIDLSALLYKYETDFATAAQISGDEAEAAKWLKAAEKRKKVTDKLMWDKTRHIYFDYNFEKKRRSRIPSLATFYPLWAGMVDEKQAKYLVSALKRFEHKGGLATTEGQPLGQYRRGGVPTQWAYPNGWAPLHFLVVKGLQRYGYHDDARRIAHKWLRTNLNWFKRHGVFLEKYNVVTPAEPPAKGLYPSQTGFGWTNAVFEHFCREFIDQNQ